MTKELSELGVGDHVILSRRDCLKCVRKIERVTKTQIAISGSLSRYRRDSGSRTGQSDFYYESISVPEEGEIERCITAIRIQKIKNYLKNYPWLRIENEEMLNKIKEMLPIQKED